MPRYAIAIDLGGTQVRAALVTSSGEILRREAVATAATAGPEAVIGQIVDVAKSVAEGTASSDILGAGVSSPGPLDSKEGIALSIASIAGFDDFPLRATLQNKLGRKVWLENDGIAAAMGEWRFGAGRGFDNVVYVTVSTGIGGGVISDGRVLRGRRGMAGHIGHMIISEDGPQCFCGNRGCWEGHASGTAFTRKARERALQSPTTTLGRNGFAIDAPAVFAAAGQGDALAQDLVREEARLLGLGIVSLLHLYSPDIVIIGGGLANGFTQLKEGIASEIGKRAMPAFRAVPVVTAGLGGNSGLLGAASLVFESPEN